MRSYAYFRCQGCKHEQRMYVHANLDCQRCGGKFERIAEHPLMAVSGGGWVGLYNNANFNEKMVEHHVKNLLEGIERRLAAEVEMDKVSKMCYDREGDSNEEEDDTNSLQIRQERSVDGVRADASSSSGGSLPSTSSDGESGSGSED